MVLGLGFHLCWGRVGLLIVEWRFGWIAVCCGGVSGGGVSGGVGWS